MKKLKIIFLICLVLAAAFNLYQAYAQAMVKDHMNDISEFKKEVTSGTDPNLKQFASDTLPTLQDHLKQAREMARIVGTPAQM